MEWVVTVVLTIPILTLAGNLTGVRKLITHPPFAARYKGPTNFVFAEAVSDSRLTTPAVALLLIRVWLITSPESAVNPEILPEVRVAVQLNIIPGSFPNKGMFVDSPVQIDFNRGGMFVTTGIGVVINCTVSFPVHPLPFVTFTQ